MRISIVRQLKIGDRVFCTELVEFCYNENNEKLPMLRSVPGGLEFIYVGNKVRYSGIYDPGARYISSIEDFEPPTFTNKKRYTVCQIRIDADSRILEALPESIKLIEDKNNVDG